MSPYLVSQLFNLALLVAALGLLYITLSGAPFLPTHTKSIETMVRMANIRRGMKVADLGSGDGRILIAFARAGAEAHGYEINPLLVWYSRWKIKRAGLEKQCFVHTKNFWNVDFSTYAVVTLFGIRHIMARLEKKLQQELRPGSRVISHVFAFPTWPCAEQNDTSLMRLYLRS